MKQREDLMAVNRQGELLIAARSPHVAYELEPGVFRLSFAPDRLVTAGQAVAGLQLAEIVAEWDHLLWGEDSGPNVAMVWQLIAMHAKALGMDALDAAIRVDQAEYPLTAEQRKAWNR